MNDGNRIRQMSPVHSRMYKLAFLHSVGFRPACSFDRSYQGLHTWQKLLIKLCVLHVNWIHLDQTFGVGLLTKVSVKLFAWTGSNKMKTTQKTDSTSQWDAHLNSFTHKTKLYGRPLCKLIETIWKRLYKWKYNCVSYI